jgi:hypothetical protein
MTMQDDIDQAHALLATGGTPTADEQAIIDRGAVLSRLQCAMIEFSALVQSDPDTAAQVVAEFQQDPSYQTLMQILGASGQ